MRIVLQRVSRAKVVVEEETVGEIEAGLLLLVGFGEGDTEARLQPMAAKLAGLRVFPDENGRFDKSIIDIGGAILAVPQFTLYGEVRKGRRPDFFKALEPKLASPLFDGFCDTLTENGVSRVERGQFGAHMKVELLNDGPVTLAIDSADIEKPS